MSLYTSNWSDKSEDYLRLFLVPYDSRKMGYIVPLFFFCFSPSKALKNTTKTKSTKDHLNINKKQTS